MLAINRYSKFNKKIISYYVVAIVLCSVCIGITLYDMKKESKFYENAEQVTGIVQKICENESNSNKMIVRITYEVDDKQYSKDLDMEASEASRYKASDQVYLFYDKENPTDCRKDTRSLKSIYFIIGILGLLDAIAIEKLLMYILRIKLNKKMLQNNKFVMAKIDKIQPVTSFSLTNLNGEKNYCIISSYEYSGKTYEYKSKRIKNIPTDLNVGDEIKVYVDEPNLSRYIVDIEKYL